MKTEPPDIALGHYARKQLFSPIWLVALSHRHRIETGLRLAARIGGRRILDYGCGDGTFLALLMDRPGAPAHAVGAEVLPDLVTDCRKRLGRSPQLTFLTTDALDHSEHRRSYDLVVCMEVLEHVVDLGTTLDRLTSFIAPGGTLLVSVPVEIGPALVIKQAARRLAGWARIGDYPGTTPYRWPELVRGLFAGERQSVSRPVHRMPDGSQFHDHKGFNWKVVRRELSRRLRLDELHTSPIARVPPAFASQVWMVARLHTS